MQAKLLKTELSNKVYDEVLKDIYVDEKLLDYQRERYQKAIDKFIELYGEQDIEIYSAPGRSEVGGNHTDHQHGCVLAAAINLDIIAVVSRKDEGIKILSDDYDIKKVDINDLDKKESELGTSEGLVRGVCAKFKESNHHIGGFNA
ncbi:MAG: galactokinase family protein, partial [Coprobacillus sp.]